MSRIFVDFFVNFEAIQISVNFHWNFCSLSLIGTMKATVEVPRVGKMTLENLQVNSTVRLIGMSGLGNDNLFHYYCKYCSDSSTSLEGFLRIFLWLLMNKIGNCEFLTKFQVTLQCKNWTCLRTLMMVVLSWWSMSSWTTLRWVSF